MITEPRQKRILLIIITVLFLANVATLILFFVAKPSKKKQGGESRKEKMQSYLKTELGYNDVQLNNYETLAKEHKASVDSMFSKMKREKENRLKEISSQDYNDSSIEQAANQMANNQKVLELKMLKHLKEVRALGDETQRLKFDTGFLRFMSRHKNKK